ncbi:hypothetical protein [Streptomyces sp. NPDC001070]
MVPRQYDRRILLRAAHLVQWTGLRQPQRGAGAAVPSTSPRSRRRGRRADRAARLLAVRSRGRLRLIAGSRAQRLPGAADTVERYHRAFGPDRDRLDGLTAHGLRFTGHDPGGEPRAA